MHTVCLSHLDALLVERILIEVEDGRLDGARRRQNRQADVDGVTPLGIQNDDLLSLAVRCRFLEHTIIIQRGSQLGLPHPPLQALSPSSPLVWMAL